MTAQLGTEGIRVAVEDGIAIATIDLPGQSANTMSAAFKREIGVVVGRLQDAPDVRGLVITSGKKTFFAGGDLRNLIAVRQDAAQSFHDGLEAFKRTLRALERLPIPVAVAINGAALGGGWEICLCAHARFCLDDVKVPLGLPEATLGLLPGAGGVNRMTRLLGLKRALPFLLEGRTFTPAQALAMGLLQGMAGTMDAVLAQAVDWVRGHPKPKVPWDQEDFSVPRLAMELPQVLVDAPLEIAAGGAARYPARQAILAAAVEGVCLDIDAALRVETRYLTHLATQQVAKNMIQTFFFESNELKGGRSRPDAAAPGRIATVAVDAALPRAAQLAVTHANRRLHTILIASTAEAETGCRSEVQGAIDTAIREGKVREERRKAIEDAITVRIEGADAPAASLRLVRVGSGQGPDPRATIVARQGRVPEGHGMALRFHPHSEGPLVEILHDAGEPTENVAAAYDYIQAIGKTPIAVRDLDEGFVGALARAAASEALALRAQGVAQDLIENACAQADLNANPFALAAEFGLAAPSGAASIPAAATVEEVQDRILTIVALEAARSLETGVVRAVRDANIGSILGLGFPRWTGGAVQYVHHYGLQRFVDHADKLAAVHGQRFAPGQLLRSLASRGAVTVEIAS